MFFFDFIDDILVFLDMVGYVVDWLFVMVLYLVFRMWCFLFLEGEVGVGKIEIVKVLLGFFGCDLICL